MNASDPNSAGEHSSGLQAGSTEVTVSFRPSTYGKTYKATLVIQVGIACTKLIANTKLNVAEKKFTKVFWKLISCFFYLKKILDPVLFFFPSVIPSEFVEHELLLYKKFASIGRYSAALMICRQLKGHLVERQFVCMK